MSCTTGEIQFWMATIFLWKGEGRSIPHCKTWWYPVEVVKYSYRIQIFVIISYSPYILNPLYTTFFEWKSNEIIKCLPITNPVFTGSKLRSDFMVRSIKRVPGTPRNLVVNRELSSWNGCTWLKDLIWILWKGLRSSFLKKE